MTAGGAIAMVGVHEVNEAQSRHRVRLQLMVALREEVHTYVFF